MISFLRKMPIIKYLVGAIAVLLVVLWWTIRRMRIAQKKLGVEMRIGAAKSTHHKALEDIKRGQGEEALSRQIKAAKQAEFYSKKRNEILKEATKLGGISNAINKAFSPDN